MPLPQGRTVLLLLIATLTGLSLGACAPWPQEAAGPLSSSTGAAALPAPQGGPAAGPSDGALDGAAVYALLAPVVAFIETPLGTGSGVLVGDGYVVTNAHVVWPYEQARVVFPDGSEYPQTAVRGMDLLVDLAVLGPLDPAVPPVFLQDGEGLPVGADVFLIGYPGEVERFPRPSISRGLISRFREWPAERLTYLQTDATVAGGQSGGALASPDGMVVGISGFSFAGAFALVASSADLTARVESLVAGEGDSVLGDRRLPLGAGRTRHQATLDNIWDVRMFVLDAMEPTTVHVEVDGDTDVFLAVVDAYGEALALIDEEYEGHEAGSATIEVPGPHFVVVGHTAEAAGRFRLHSSHPLLAYHDADDGLRVASGGRLTGCLDHPWDADYYVIDLREGETIEIVVDSVMIDPYLSVDYIGASEEQVASDDDSGGGLFGLNAGLIYTAGHSGEYFIVVEDAEQLEIGGYILTVTARP